MRFLGLIALTFSMHVMANSGYHASLLEPDEVLLTSARNDLPTLTRDALMSYDKVEERANYFVFKLKNMTFGDYTDQVLIITPFITGQLEFTFNEVNFYYDHQGSESGFRYELRF